MVRYLCSRLTWNTARNAWRMLGEFWKAPVNFEVKCRVFKATAQGPLLAGSCACAAQHGSLAENEILPLESSILCNDEEELGQ